MQATELVIKNKKFIDTLSDVSKGSFEDRCANNGRNLKTFFISGSSGPGKSRLQKIWQEELTSLTARVSIQFILLQWQKMERHKDFIDSEYKAQDRQSFDDIDATSFDSRSSKRI